MTDIQLGKTAAAAGYRLVVHEAVASTNSDAMARARAGDTGPVWVVTTEQTAGRGRRGRAWVAPRGNLAASLMMVTDVPPVTAAGLGFVAGLALTDALARLLPDSGPATAGEAERGGRFSLKWPNDVLADGAKLAGILLEAEPLANGRLAVVVGIGVNVVAAPDGLAYAATALAGFDAAITAGALFRQLSECWVGLIDRWDDGRGLPALLAVWRGRAMGLGTSVTVQLGTSTLSGRFETLDDAGRLVLVDDAGRRHTVSAGDVHFGVAGTAPRVH